MKLRTDGFMIGVRHDFDTPAMVLLRACDMLTRLHQSLVISFLLIGGGAAAWPQFMRSIYVDAAGRPFDSPGHCCPCPRCERTTTEWLSDYDYRCVDCGLGFRCKLQDGFCRTYQRAAVSHEIPRAGLIHEEDWPPPKIASRD